MRDYDSWKLANGLKGKKVYKTCDCCGEPIYYGEDYLVIVGVGEDIHTDCYTYEYMEEVLNPMKATSP